VSVRVCPHADAPDVSEVGFGSIATASLGAGSDQCLLFPASDQIALTSRMARRAKRRLSTPQQMRSYSIISSAVAISAGGTITLRALAVVKLIIVQIWSAPAAGISFADPLSDVDATALLLTPILHDSTESDLLIYKPSAWAIPFAQAPPSSNANSQVMTPPNSFD
jgi:hypothetical protein